MNPSPDADGLRPLFDRIKAGDRCGEEQLYVLMNRGLRFFIARELGPDNIEDILHETFMAVVRAIRDDRIEKPEALLGYARTIVQRQITAVIKERMRDRAKVVSIDDHDCPTSARLEESEIRKQEIRIATQVLEHLPVSVRDILHRFYVLEQPREQICQELNLNTDQYRNAKHRAKLLFESRLKRKVCGSVKSTYGTNIKLSA
jgi:RNA polymerase sigma factor (sigma-70 family)